ncbi:hypothetical protein pEaSNUABM55_00204 [Erwinia phage pEa_SNUABM_55]|nr:hypothetical protein pEaSNUABM55_00204 [Erwinia phage pEa_SNUABM_55]
MITNKDGSLKEVVKGFAQRRGLDVTLHDADDMRQVWIWDLENECEPLVMYRLNDDETLSYYSNLFSKLEDLPVWIDEKQKFNKLLDYVSDMLKSDKM